MRNLVLGTEQEGLLAVSFFQPMEGFVGDDLGRVPVYFGFSIRGKKSGVEIGTLSAFAGKNSSVGLPLRCHLPIKPVW